MTGRNSQNCNNNYLKYVRALDPPTKHFKNCLAAFGVGGLICTIGQFLRYMLAYAGAGSIVPITGFANSVTSPAIEFKTEGFIYGTAAKMFNVAGAIIVYGVFSGVIVGIIYYFL